MFMVILSFYTDIQSCVKNGDLQSNSSPYETGVRQGDKLFPVVFVLYLKDLEEYLSVNYANHLELLNENCIQHIGMYLKLFFCHFMLMTQLFLLNQLKNYRLLLIILKSTAQNGSSLVIFQKNKIVFLFKKKVQ